MKKTDLQIGDVVQISPAASPDFGGCFMVVTEPKPWGAQGWCPAPASKGRIYYRAKFEHMELVGKAAWVTE